MIPVSTSPGTLVVYAHPKKAKHYAFMPIPELEHRRVYTLQSITTNKFNYTVVELQEVGKLHYVKDGTYNCTWAYPIACFELAVLPRVLRACFNRQPKDAVIIIR